MKTPTIMLWLTRLSAEAAFAIGCLTATSGFSQDVDLLFRTQTFPQEQRLRIPPTNTPNNNGYNPTNDILRGIFNGIDQAARNQQNMRPQYQPQYQQQQQYRPQTQQYRQQSNSNNYRPQTNTVPRNVQTVRNVLPSAKSIPNANPFASAAFALLTPDQAQSLIAGANRDVSSQLDANRALQNKVTDDFVAGLPLTPAQQQALAAAIKAGDVATVQSLLPAGLPPGAATTATNAAQWFEGFNRLDTAVRLGKPADDIAPLITEMKRLDDILQPTSISAVRFDPVLAQLRQRDALYNAMVPGGTLVSTIGGFPLGSTTVMYFPTLPPGIVMVAGNAFVTGGPLEMQPITTAQVLGLPVGTSEPLPEGSGDPSIGLTLVNPKKNGVPFNYTLDDRSKSLASGQAESFTDGPEWIVLFDRGEGNATARHKVVAGSYQFTVAGGSWDLTKQTYETTIDNSANNNAFHYVINSEPAIVEPRSSRTHTSDYPPVIEFDNGSGQDRTKKVTEAKATYRVGIDSASNTWDLFDSVAPGGLQSNALATTSTTGTPVTALKLGAGLNN